MAKNTALRKHIISIILLSGLIYTISAGATTILGVDIDKVANDAELVFEGEVILQESRHDARSGLINTYVTFAIYDILKGINSSNTIELKFAGGATNGEIIEVGGLSIPKIGEQGIYFIESTTRDLLNPILGWSQGHFIIEEENGDRRVSTINRHPVTKIQPVSTIPATIKKPRLLVEGKNDVAAGVLVDPNDLALDRALTVEEFKNSILELLTD